MAIFLSQLPKDQNYRHESHYAWLVITFRVVENHDKISFLRFAFHSDTVILGRNSVTPIAMVCSFIGAKKIPGCWNSKIQRKH